MNTEVRDHAIFLKGALDLITGSTTADTGDSTYIRIVRATETTAFTSRVTGDTQPRYEVYAGGETRFGTGAAVADARLYRFSAGSVAMDASASANSTTFRVISTAGQRSLVALTVAGDGVPRLALSGDATMQGVVLGDGSAAGDTNLYRQAPNVLRTDDQFWAIDGITTRTVAGAVGDGSFTVTPQNGTIAIDTTNLYIYCRIGGVWKRTAALV